MTVIDAPPLAIDMTVKAQEYRKIKEKIKEIEDRHKEELAPYKDALADMKAFLLAALNEMSAENIQTPEGTIHKVTRKSYPLEDQSAFLGFIVENRAWEMLDLKCNSTAAAEFLETHGALPPGVRLSVHVESSVLAPRKKG